MVYTSEGIQVKHIIGAVKEVTEKEVGMYGPTYRMGGAHPRESFTLLYDVIDDIPQEEIFFQFVVKFVNLRNQWYGSLIDILWYFGFIRLQTRYVSLNIYN